MSPQRIKWSTWLLVQEAWNREEKALGGQLWRWNGQVWTSQAEASPTSGQEGPGSYYNSSSICLPACINMVPMSLPSAVVTGKNYRTSLWWWCSFIMVVSSLFLLMMLWNGTSLTISWLFCVLNSSLYIHQIDSLTQTGVSLTYSSC